MRFEVFRGQVGVHQDEENTHVGEPLAQEVVSIDESVRPCFISCCYRSEIFTAHSRSYVETDPERLVILLAIPLSNLLQLFNGVLIRYLVGLESRLCRQSGICRKNLESHFTIPSLCLRSG